MVRKLTALFALILTLGMAVSPVAAQDVDTEALEQFGLENGYFRMYMATDTTSTAMVAMIGGWQFQDEDAAAENFDVVACGFASGFSGLEAEDCDTLADAGDVTVEDADGLGDQAKRFTGEAEGMAYAMLTIQDAEYIYMIISMGEGEQDFAPLDAIGEFMVDAEPVDTEVEFRQDGTSTGGFFDMLPTGDDDVLAGFVPMQDMDFMNENEATPAS